MTTEAVTTTTEETLAQEEQEAKEFKSLVRIIIAVVNMINITIAITRSIMMNNMKS